MQVSVKVMKSYDYCHFEATLTKTVDGDPDGQSFADEREALRDEADALGVDAQELCDRQIERYKRQKAHCEDCNAFDGYEAQRVFAAIDKVPETERTPDMKAAVKAKQDYLHWRERDFDYKDDVDLAGPGDYSVLRDQLKAVLPDIPF